MTARSFTKLRNASLVLIGLALSIITGLVGSKSTKFDFTSAAVVATAIATLALAYLTATLASVTREDAFGTRKLAELAERDLNQRDTGILVVLQVDYDPGSFIARVRLKNVGLGPAVYITTVVELRTVEHRPLMTGTSTNNYALASEEEAAVDIRLEAAPGFTGKALVEEMLAYGTFLGRGGSPRHFLWRRNEQRQVFGLWGDLATPDQMASIVRRPNWATLQP